jgi:hypothetical protein
VSANEVRKSPRFRATLRVHITGVDDRSVLRAGDISSTGLFLEIDHDVGAIGSMQRVQLSAEDGSCPVIVLARVVRIASVEDFWKGRTVAGVALQFMFVEEPSVDAADAGSNTARPANESATLQGLLKYLVKRDAAKHGLEVQSWRGTVSSQQGEQPAELHQVSPRGMAIETDYPVDIGTVIRVEMPTPADASPSSFSGQVTGCEPVRAKLGRAERYRVVVRFESEDSSPLSERPAGESMDAAFEALLHAVTSLAPPPHSALRVRHLAGELSRISLISVITLCQIERVTGSLLLRNGTSSIRAFLQEGELVDAVVAGREVDPRAALKEVIGWRDGSFEVAFEPCEGPNRIGLPTSALLLDLVREMDEEGRKA